MPRFNRASAWCQPASRLYGGLPFLLGGFRELRARMPGMMTLIALAITVAFVYGLLVARRIGR